MHLVVVVVLGTAYSPAMQDTGQAGRQTGNTEPVRPEDRTNKMFITAQHTVATQPGIVCTSLIK